MKIITLGNGFIANSLPYQKILDRIEPCDKQIMKLLNYHKPDILINCIGMCGNPSVDQCEIEKEKTLLANTIIPTLLAIECEKLGIHLIHIGSGCIYFGASPNYRYVVPQIVVNAKPVRCDLGWKETDFANPQSFYSKTKYAADLAIGSLQTTTILRIRMPISTKNDPRNFINKIRGYSRVIDEPNSVSFVDDVVRCVDWVATEHKFGIYHATNPQTISAAETMREFQKYFPEHKFDVINTDELDKITIAKRSNCIIDATKLRNDGFTMTLAKDALEECMSKYVKNI